MSLSYSGVLTHTVTIGAETYVQFSMNGGSVSGNENTIDLTAIESSSTGLVSIEDSSGASGPTAGGALAYDGTGIFSPVAGSTFDLSALVAAGITMVHYIVTITGVTGSVPRTLTGILSEPDGGPYTAAIVNEVVAAPAVKAVVSDFAATFSAGTNTLSSVTIPYTQVVEFYDSSDTLGNTFPADDIVPITLSALSGDAGPLPIPLTYQAGVGYGLSGTVDTTELGSPITFTLTMGQDSGALHLSVDAAEYSLAVQVPPVEPPVVGTIEKALVSDFAATFGAGTAILTSVTIPYTQVVGFYDGSNNLGSTFPADNVVPITLFGFSDGIEPVNIPLTYQAGVGYGLSGSTFDATAIGEPLLFILAMDGNTGDVYTSLLGSQYELVVQEETVDPPVEPSSGPTITLNHLFTPSAGQTYTYSILGETPGTITADERIVLNVPQAEMNKLLAYSSNWDDGLTGSEGSQAIPDVALLLNTVTGSWFDALTMGLTGATQGTSYAYSTTFGYVQGDESSNCKTLLYQFQSIAGFTYTTPGVVGESNVLDSIPREAIKSFTSGPVSTASLSGVVGDTVVPGSTSQSAEYAGLSGAIQSLFEQAVNAGLVTSTSKGSLLNSTVVTGLTGTPTLETALGTTGSVYGAQWSAGQSLGIYVQFQMQKTRRYQLATLPSFGGSTSNQALEIAFGGVTFTVNPNVVETSGSTPVTYEIILNTIA